MSDNRVLQRVVRSAVGVVTHLGGERRHERGTCREVDVACGIEGPGDENQGVSRLEEGLAVLEKERKRETGCECRVGKEGSEEGWATGHGEVATETGVERAREG